MGSLLERIVECEQADQELLSGAGGNAVVDALVRHAAERGVTHVIGASRSGERLVGAVLVAAGGALRLWQPTAGGPVLVIEGPAVGDVAVRAALRRTAATGATAYAVMVGGPLAGRDVVERLELVPLQRLTA